MLAKRFGIFKRKQRSSPERLSTDDISQDTVLNRDELADIASQDSFPASDPPSYGPPTSIGAPDDRKTATAKSTAKKKTAAQMRRAKAKRKSA